MLSPITTKEGIKKSVWKCYETENGKEHKCPMVTPATIRMEKYFKDRWIDYSYNALHPLPEGPPEEDSK